MPSYKVIAKGFYENNIYDPNGKRKELHVDKALKPCPEWLTPIKKESTAKKRQREAAEAAVKKQEAEKQKQDQIDVNAVTFTEVPKDHVETL